MSCDECAVVHSNHSADHRVVRPLTATRHHGHERLIFQGLRCRLDHDRARRAWVERRTQIFVNESEQLLPRSRSAAEHLRQGSGSLMTMQCCSSPARADEWAG
jgi:hypothetical protein